MLQQKRRLPRTPIDQSQVNSSNGYKTPHSVQPGSLDPDGRIYWEPEPIQCGSLSQAETLTRNPYNSITDDAGVQIAVSSCRQASGDQSNSIHSALYNVIDGIDSDVPKLQTSTRLSTLNSGGNVSYVFSFIL